MGLSADKIGSFFTKLLQKGDPSAAMAGGKGPVTPEWAAAHGYTQFRTPGMPTMKGVAEVTPSGVSLYGVYTKEKQEKKRVEAVKKGVKQKKTEAEERKRKSRLLRRPSRERGIL
jgi:hypothetical protein